MNAEDKGRFNLQILRESAHQLSATLDESKIIELLLQQSKTASRDLQAQRWPRPAFSFCIGLFDGDLDRTQTDPLSLPAFVR